MQSSSDINASELFFIVRQRIEEELLIKNRDIDSIRIANKKKLEMLKDKYSQKCGAFVTITKKNNLRGCIGYIPPIYSLFDTLTQCAKAAAFEDPRFKPITKDEYPDISIEISILSIPEVIKVQKKEQTPSEIKIGRDGLIIRKGRYSGLLLPQVFTEYKVTPVQALEMTCQKAGLLPNDWKSPECSIEKFHATIYSESKKDLQ